MQHSSSKDAAFLGKPLGNTGWVSCLLQGCSKQRPQGPLALCVGGERQCFNASLLTRERIPIFRRKEPFFLSGPAALQRELPPYWITTEFLQKSKDWCNMRFWEIRKRNFRWPMSGTYPHAGGSYLCPRMSRGVTVRVKSLFSAPELLCLYWVCVARFW